MTAEPHVACQALSCARGGRTLWHNLDLELSAGGAVHIMGSNGLGKSSLLRVIAGLLPAASGTIERSGTIGLMDEGMAIDRAMPLSSALAFWSDLDAAPPAAVADALETVGLGALAHVPLRLFSTGQRKRAALARLLIQRADIWLLDEPLNGLDGDGAERLTTQIDAHRAHGGIVIAASHQPLAIADMAAINLADHAA